jgi:RNA polymerase sigma factor (sigma-70 family)
MGGSISNVIHHLRKAAALHKDADLTDGQLLERFAKNRDRGALETLVHRHGQMVWGVCCRILRAGPDAEDAFQAAFLVLVRRAGDAPRATVANWLYGVAHQTALKARATIGKRKGRERQVTDMPEAAAPPPVLRDDLHEILDEELSRLSDKHRTVIVLSDLEGKTRKEVAQLLGMPEGTVASRLARAHSLLAHRLTRRGLTVSSGAVAALLAQQAASATCPAAAVDATITSVAGGAVSAKTAALVDGVLKAMLLSRLKFGAIWLVLGLLTVGSGLGAYQALAAKMDLDGQSGDALVQPARKEPDRPAKKETDKAPAPQPTAWFEGGLAEFHAPAEPGKEFFARIKVQNAKDTFLFHVTTKTRIFQMVDGKRQPAQFTDLTPNSTIRAGYGPEVNATDPPLAVAEEIVIVTAVPVRVGAVFEGDAEVGAGVPFQDNVKDHQGTFLLRTKNDHVVFHVPRSAVLVKVVNGKQRPATYADLVNKSKVRVYAPGAQDLSDPPQMGAEQILIHERPGKAKEPGPLPEEAAAAWRKAGAQVGRMRKPGLDYVFGYDRGDFIPDEKAHAGEIPAFQYGLRRQKFSADDPPWRTGVLPKLPDPGVPFALDLSATQVSDADLKELAGFKSLHTLWLGVDKNVSDAGMKELAGLTNLQALDLGNTKVTDAGLKELAGLSNLRSLSLYNTKVTDDGLKHLARLKNLQYLDLNGTRITNAGLTELAGLTDLKALSIGDAGFHTSVIADAGLKHLAGLKNLQFLDLNHSKVTDAGLKELAVLEELRSLRLDFTSVGDAGLKELAGLKKVQYLYLTQTQVTDEGLKALAGMKDLRGLRLTYVNNITDAGLKQLAGTKRLERLDVYGNPVTLTGLTALQKELPSCDITAQGYFK